MKRVVAQNLTTGKEGQRINFSRKDFNKLALSAIIALLLGACGRRDVSDPAIIEPQEGTIKDNNALISTISDKMGITPLTNQADYAQAAYERTYNDTNWEKNAELGQVSLPIGNVDLKLDFAGDPEFDVTGIDAKIYKPNPVITTILKPENGTDPTIVIYGSVQTNAGFEVESIPTVAGTKLLKYFAKIFESSNLDQDVTKVVHLVFVPPDSLSDLAVIKKPDSQDEIEAIPAKEVRSGSARTVTARVEKTGEITHPIKRVEIVFNLPAIYIDASFLSDSPTLNLLATISNERANLLAQALSPIAAERSQSFSSYAGLLMLLGGPEKWNSVLLDGAEPNDLVPVMEEVKRLFDLAAKQ